MRNTKQNTDESAIAFLISKSIKMLVNIIEFALTQEIVQKLSNQGILYIHSPIP